MKTVYIAPGKHFRRVTDPERLRQVKAKYQLPHRFIFTLSGYDRGHRKNIDRIIESYQLFHGRTDDKLLVGGRDCHRFRDDFGIPNDGYGGDIQFPGWMEQEDLPAVYTLASVYLYPSYVEAFPIPLTEAMSCGAPIITSDLNGLQRSPEIVRCSSMPMTRLPSPTPWSGSSPTLASRRTCVRRDSRERRSSLGTDVRGNSCGAREPELRIRRRPGNGDPRPRHTVEVALILPHPRAGG